VQKPAEIKRGKSIKMDAGSLIMGNHIECEAISDGYSGRVFHIGRLINRIEKPLINTADIFTINF
jgi:hypothetical protein